MEEDDEMSPEDEYLDRHRDTIEQAFTKALAGIVADKAEDPLAALAQHLEMQAVEQKALRTMHQIRRAASTVGAETLSRMPADDVVELSERFARFERNGKLGRPELSAMLIDACPSLETRLESSDEDGVTFLDRLYDAFDVNSDGELDANELAISWHSWFSNAKPVHALLIIDVQNDFISGSLSLSNCPAGQNGADVVPVINQLIDAVAWDVVAISYDWHPHTHCSFYETFKENACPVPLHDTAGDTAGAGLFDIVTLTAPDGSSAMPQTLWPRHCVQGSWGAALHDELRPPAEHIVVYKGTDPGVDSYSAFYDNSKYKQTTLLSDLRKRGVTHVHICGLALDICVAFSALHAAEEGFVTSCIDDACRGVSAEGISSQKKLMVDAGVHLLQAADVPAFAAAAAADQYVVAAQCVSRAKEAHRSLLSRVQGSGGHMPSPKKMQSPQKMNGAQWP